MHKESMHKQSKSMLRTAFVGLLVWLGTAPLASAAIVYEFGQANYDVAAGQRINVDLFLVQTDVGSDPVNLSVDGLFSGGVRVFFDDTPPTDPAGVRSLADILPNPSFDDTFIGETLDLVPGVSAGFSDAIDNFDAPIRGSRIFLGTFAFTAGNVIGETTNLRATDFDSRFSDVLANDLGATELDNLIQPGFATITVTAVPEPSGVIVVGVGLSCLITLRRRRNASIVDRRTYLEKC